MISIVICSIKEDFFITLEKNIQGTIGDVAYEIIKINNNIEKLSITKAYNLGIDRSKFKHLLFIHEDILFHSKNWGKVLIDTFKNSNVGLVGIAGAKYKSKQPSAFWHTNMEMLHINLIQHKNNSSNLFTNGFANNQEEVAILDGVFLGLNKETNVRFNEQILGFHCYDLGISIDVLEKKYKLIVTNQILIEHFSIGNTDVEFLKGVIQFHELYKNKLPKFINKSSNKLEKIALRKFLEVCLQNRYIPYRLWILNIFNNPFQKLNYNLLKLAIYKLLHNNG